MKLSPEPRNRLYGSPVNYGRIAAAILTGRVRRPEGDVSAFERRLAAFTGARHVLSLPQGRLGLFLALRALIRPGQEVVLSPYTIFDVVNMVVAAGGRPVFADVDPVSCNIDPVEIEGRIGPDTGAVLATHLQGLACEIEAIADLCRSRDVPLIEDAAQCLGGRVGGRHVGTFGRVGILSFGQAKNVNAIYGGAAITADQELDASMRRALATLPLESTARLLKKAGSGLLMEVSTAPGIFQFGTFWFVRWECLSGRQNWLASTESHPVLRTEIPESYLRRITPLQARMADAQLDGVDSDADRRLAVARIYRDGLAHLPEVQLPPWREDLSHIYLNYPIQVARRDNLVKEMVRRGRDLRAQYYRCLSHEPCFSDFYASCPRASAVAARVVLLPTYPGYGAAEAHDNIRAIRAFYECDRPQMRSIGRESEAA